ncbi:hypothetical protein C2R22_03265 [Salinigranum rubrum]|uniref:DUF1468 domain-containing protein n=1 Tax=Salinigranum rubrum TaxID=755307 RepID=A0A2I8VFV1_9EURY|nr:tripartite tricarboxylate transporter TctB family protein [Salinigranum rubrum]AUV80795.1 hypothetical protein C2R22_03265 [Salinigranum rubrum]
MLEKVREDPYEFLFLAVVAITVITAYIETTTFLEMSAVVPQFILYLVGATLIGIMIMKFRGDQIKEKLGLSDVSAGFDLGTDDEGEDDSDLEGLYDLNTVGVAKEFVWLIVYVVGVVFVGFFTVSAAFCIVYVLVNETSELKRRIPLALGWTAIILGVLYLLFVEFLQVSSVWRLGFLP